MIYVLDIFLVLVNSVRPKFDILFNVCHTSCVAYVVPNFVSTPSSYCFHRLHSISINAHSAPAGEAASASASALPEDATKLDLYLSLPLDLE